MGRTCQCAQRLPCVARVAKALKNAPTAVPALVKESASNDDPWCLLDTHHRQMESRRYDFEFAVNGEHDKLEKLLTRAEQRYTEVGSGLAKLFVKNFQRAIHPIKEILQQRDVFEKQVKPLLGEGKVAYVWVDGKSAHASTRRQQNGLSVVPRV